MTYPSETQREMLIRRLDHLTGDLLAHLDRLESVEGLLEVSKDDLRLLRVEIRGAIARVRKDLRKNPKKE